MHLMRSSLQVSPVYDTYWRFAAERQAVFFRRLATTHGPWTSDPIIAQHKFTNAYRASDRVSQFLIRHVIYDGKQRSAQDTFFRIMLFKLFNKIETWEVLERAHGPISWNAKQLNAYGNTLSAEMAAGHRIYSAAYIMPSGGKLAISSKKHQWHLQLLKHMMDQEFPKRIIGCSGLHQVFQEMLSLPSIGDFLAYQFAVDLNYSDIIDFSENSFVVPGPGARDGIRKCFTHTGNMSETDIIAHMCERQGEEFRRLGLQFQDLWGRPLHYIDCQNLFCEVDKYARVAHPDISGRTGRTRIKQSFRPKPVSIMFMYPPKWGINAAISAEGRRIQAAVPL